MAKHGRISLAATTLTDGIKTITTAGTPEQISTTSVPCEYVMVSPLTTNTGYVALGGSTVIATATQMRGIALGTGHSPVLVPVDDLNKIYLDVEFAGQGISYITLG